MAIETPAAAGGSNPPSVAPTWQLTLHHFLRLPLLQTCFVALLVAQVPIYAKLIIGSLGQTNNKSKKPRAPPPDWEAWDVIWETPPRPPVRIPFKPVFSTVTFCIELLLLLLRTWFLSRDLSAEFGSPRLPCLVSLVITGMVYVEHRHELPPSTLLRLFLGVFILSHLGNTSLYFTNGMVVAGALSSLAAMTTLAVLSFEHVLKPYYLDKLDQRRLNRLWEEATDGLWKRYIILWCNSILAIAFNQEITADDLKDIGPKYNSETLHEHFDKSWQSGDKVSKYALPKALLRAFFWDFAIIFVPKICYSACLMGQPLLLSALVSAVGAGPIPQSTFTGIASATILIYLGIALTRAAHHHLDCRVITIVRGTFVTALYRKSLRMGHEPLKNDEFLTLMSTDIEGIEECITSLPNAVAVILELGSTILLLWKMSGTASLLPLLPAIISLVPAALSPLNAARAAEAERLWNEKTNARVAATANALRQLKGLKVSGFEADMTNHIRTLRAREIRTLQHERWARVARHATAYFCETFTPVMAIAGAVFWNGSSNGFDVPGTFAVLSSISITTDHLTDLLMFFPGIPQGYACAKRLQAFLLQDEITGDVLDIEGTEMEQSSLLPRSTTYAIELVKATVVYPGRGVCFRDLDLFVRAELITMLIGPVGTGKSTILKTILGEVELTNGSVRKAPGAVAYCGQTAWLQNLSIRDNIISRSNFNPKWYAKVVYACALNEDLAQLADGDATLIGNGGVKLSGGQRQRVALARAVYSHLEVVLLDDILSTLDIVTSQTILARLFGENGLLRTLKTTVLMVTTSRDHLRYAHDILTLTSDGTIQRSEQGRTASHAVTSSRLMSWVGRAPTNPRQPGTDRSRIEATAANLQHLEADSRMDDEKRKRGDFSLYVYYLRSTGLILILPWLLQMAMTALSDRVPSIVFRVWMGRDPSNAVYFTTYAISGLGLLIMAPLTIGIFFLKLVPKSSMELHERLLHSVMRAKLWYFTKQGAGSLINRFSTDMMTMSHWLPKYFMQASFLTFQIPIDICIIAFGGSYMIAVIPVAFIAIYFIQSFFLRASRQMSLLGLDSQAPLYNHFAETAAGIQHIRAFRWQRDFIWQCLAYLDYSQRPHYYRFCMRWWLRLSADLAIVGIALIVVTVAMLYPERTSPAAVGLSMVTIVTLSGRIRVFADSWAQLETSLGSVSRLRDFVEDAPLEEADAAGEGVPDNWPRTGAISFDQVSASYNVRDLYSPSVLHDVSLQINPGDKVGIVGRTGSGKSSLMLTMLKFLDYSGTIKIDGRGLETVPHDLLRQRLVSVSQEDIEPLGSLREALEPFFSSSSRERASDEAMIGALTRARLWQTIATRGCGLDTDVSALQLTKGQTQLLGIARAMLRRETTQSPIILMDEALSSVDHETAQLVQATMMECFADCTVVTIAHRLELVENCKLIIEMDEGRIVQTLDTRGAESASGGVSLAE